METTTEKNREESRFLEAPLVSETDSELKNCFGWLPTELCLNEVNLSKPGIQLLYSKFVSDLEFSFSNPGSDLIFSFSNPGLFEF